MSYRIPYMPLASRPSPESPSIALEDIDYHNDEVIAQFRPPRSRNIIGISEATAWKVFVSSCIISLMLSTANLAILSWTSTHKGYGGHRKGEGAHLTPLKRPSVYLGLENVVFDPPYCRSRGTFPKSFAVYDTRDGMHAKLQRVHAPDDRMSLSFGGPIRAVVEAYIPDYGLENCTMSVQRMQATNDLPYDGEKAMANVTTEIDIYLLPSADEVDRPHGVFLDTLTFAPGTRSTSRPFHCPSRSNIHFEWRCNAPAECAVVLPLEGVTSLTASAESLQKTGFRITQYEAMSCIPEQRA